MAVLMMDGDDKKPIFHDFLGISCENYKSTVFASETTGMEADASALASVGVSSGEDGLVSGSSDPANVGQVMNNSDVFLIHGRKNDSSGPNDRNAFAGKKRSNSDSAYMGIVNSEYSRSPKMLGKEMISEGRGRRQMEEMQLSMQPPSRPPSSIVLHSSLGYRPDLLSERSITMNPASVAHYPSPITRSGLLSALHASKDATVSSVLISQPAADEGSRTGMKGCEVVNVVTSTSVGCDRSTATVLPCSSSWPKPQIVKPDSSNSSRRHDKPNIGRQMTIFYGGQAHVFDNVHPNKAEVIMALAGSSGVSWSTTYNRKPAMPPAEVKLPVGEHRRHTNTLPLLKGNHEASKTSVTRDIHSLTAGAQHSIRAVRDGRLGTQLSLPRTEGSGDAN